MSADSPDELTLLENEELLHEITPSWGRWGNAILVGVIGILFFGAGLAILLWVWLKRKNTKYYVTNYRVKEKSGVMGTDTTECWICDIKQIGTGTSWAEELLDKGNITLSTGSEGIVSSYGFGGGSSISLKGTPNHREVAETIRTVQFHWKKWMVN